MSDPYLYTRVRNLESALQQAIHTRTEESRIRKHMLEGRCEICGRPRNWSLNGHIQAVCVQCLNRAIREHGAVTQGQP